MHAGKLTGFLRAAGACHPYGRADRYLRPLLLELWALELAWGAACGFSAALCGSEPLGHTASLCVKAWWSFLPLQHHIILTSILRLRTPEVPVSWLFLCSLDGLGRDHFRSGPIDADVA